MKVQDVMTKDVVTVRPETTLKEVAAILAARRISGVPVLGDEDEVVGVVSEGDFLFKERGPSGRRHGLFSWLADPAGLDARLKLEAVTAGAAMSSPAVTVAPYRTVSAAAALMLEHQVNRLPVVDGEGHLAGIVTRADLVRTFVRPDAELEREIREDVLCRAMWLRAPDAVTVGVSDGKVELGGLVDTPTEAEIAPVLVAKVPGVVAVDSSLRPRDDRRA